MVKKNLSTVKTVLGIIALFLQYIIQVPAELQQICVYFFIFTGTFKFFAQLRELIGKRLAQGRVGDLAL